MFRAKESPYGLRLLLVFVSEFFEESKMFRGLAPPALVSISCLRQNPGLIADMPAQSLGEPSQSLWEPTQSLGERAEV